MTTTPRDHELGAALRALETPEHAPTFEADLRRRLAEARLSGEPAVPRSRRSRHRRVARRVLLAAAFVAVTALAVVPLADRLARAIDPGHLKAQGLFRPELPQRWYDALISGRRDTSWQLWTLVAFQAWQERQAA